MQIGWKTFEDMPEHVQEKAKELKKNLFDSFYNFNEQAFHDKWTVQDCMMVQYIALTSVVVSYCKHYDFNTNADITHQCALEELYRSAKASLKNMDMEQNQNQGGMQ